MGISTPLEYLESLPRSTLDQLYLFPSCAIGVLRLLSNLANIIIFRLLYTDTITKKLFDPYNFDHLRLASQDLVSVQNIKDYLKCQDKKPITEALHCLSKLYIISTSNDNIILNKKFQKGLHLALVGGDKTSSFGHPAPPSDKSSQSPEALDKYALETWENVLHYLVGTVAIDRDSAIALLLEKTGLMRKSGTKGMQITSEGFQFLLQDMDVQIWSLLIQYLYMGSDLEMDPSDMMSFMLQLSSLEFGRDYSVEILSQSQKLMLNDLRNLGIVFHKNKKSSRFYPTRIATLLSSGNAMGSHFKTVYQTTQSDTTDSGFIIVETNYRIYAYTDSTLQIATLGLFIDMNTRFANMVVGMITRDSVRAGLARGITAEQIISFLSSNAHPELRKNVSKTPVLPSTVVDQIRLWELEKNRISTIKGTLFKKFGKDQDFRDLLAYANGLGYLVWSSTERRMLVVSQEGHEHVRKFLISKSGSGARLERDRP